MQEVEATLVESLIEFEKLNKKVINLTRRLVDLRAEIVRTKAQIELLRS